MQFNIMYSPIVDCSPELLRAMNLPSHHHHHHPHGPMTGSQLNNQQSGPMAPFMTSGVQQPQYGNYIFVVYMNTDNFVGTK